MVSSADPLLYKTTRWRIINRALYMSLLRVFHHAFCPYDVPVPVKKQVQNGFPVVYANAPEGQT
jgi:hypothetical protein